MSTLGGNRGERNAKPKFQQLDINSLYRSSRGETSEPTAQKNTAPRKHGMQSLGKVPSARRPPANLPSLKAETSSPANTPTLSNDQQQQQTTNSSSSASWAESGAAEGARPLNATASGKQAQLNTSGGSSNQTLSASSSSSTSWSAVATGAGVKEENLSQPPLYQSSQFQNEFPSLDGSVTTNVNATAAGQKQQNPNSNSHDSGEQMSLRPSTDAASWMQQQQLNSGNARGGGGENGQGNYQQQDLSVPPKYMALMPSFMLRGAQPASSNSPSSSPHPQQTHSSNQMNQNSGNNSGNYQNQARSDRGRNSSHYGGSSYNNDYSNNRDLGPPRHRQAQPPRHSGRQQHDDRGSSYEPEIIVQRPIIKEEELERIDSLARDEGWSKHDEIDYNKKIQFSDDEADDVKPKDMMSNEKKLDVWRDGEKKDMTKQQNGPVSRIDPALAERLQKRREEEERFDRERKLAAQKKLLELEEKAKKSSAPMEKEKVLDEKQTYSGDYDRKRGSGSIDYGKKYGNDKYDSYDNYGRGAPAGDFKKTSYQSNLPPRFQKQQHIDRRDDDQRDDRRDKPGPPGYKPLHQQDSKNVPFAQQPYEQRWTYNKQSQQAPPNRRNMSSLSQSSSDDNRRDNTKGYGRRRLESEEDDYRYTKEPTTQSKKSVQAQITRSMSDSSDKLSEHNRSEKSTSREFLGTNVCWAEDCENDKRTVDTKTRRVSESSAMSDDQPRTILQRNKPLHDQLLNKDAKKESKESTDGEKKSVLSESPPKSDLGDDKKTQEKAADLAQVTLEQNKKSLESIPEKDQNPIDKLDAAKGSSKPTQLKESDDNRHARDKKTSPRSNHYDRDSRFGPPTRGNYAQRGGNWQGRRGSHQRGGRYDYTDSENSDDYDQEWNRNGTKNTMGRKDPREGRRENSNYIGGSKEGFSPRGEPSRRGRGGVAGGPQTTGFRRSGSNGAVAAPAKNRIDNYGPPSSKSPFGSNDEKSTSEKRENVKEKSSDDDRTKQKQKALSDGLMNKSQKETSNVATKASSPGAPVKYDEVVKQHSTEPTPVGEAKDKKTIEGIDDKTLSGQRSNSSSSFNSNQNRTKSDRATPTNISTAPGKPGTKPAQTNTMPAGKPTPAPTSHQYPPPMAKSMDPRHQMNRSDPRMDPRNASLNNINGRSAPRFTNKRDMPGSGPTNNMNRMGGNYWDKNHPDQMHGSVGDDKMSMMQMNPSSGPQGNLHSSQTNNILNSKTDAMKQQNQQQPPSMQQQQQQQQQQQNPTMLDGASLKTTLIFENTSYKSGPPAGIKRPQGPPPMGQQKPQENQINTINDMIDQQQANEQSLSSALQKISFGQNSQKDMDMNFSYPFDTQIGLLTDDRNKSSFGVVSSGSNTNVHPSQAVSKASSLGLVGAKTGMQNSNILNTDALNMKVASCKKVWEEPSVSMEHGSVANDDVISNFVAQQHHLQYGHNNMSSHHSGPQSYGGYGSSSANDHNSSLEHFNKSNDNDDGSSYPSPGQQQHMSNMVHSQNQQANMNMKAAEAFGTTANVCKVKPTQQQMHQAGLSPPPQMQQNQLQQQQQTYYSTPNYPNMSTIPSPPAVVYNTQSATGGLYNPYNVDAARAQLYGYQTGGTVGANNSMSFNAFMQTPNLASAPTHEMYQNLSQYRAAVQPFNQTPQLNNPNAAVLISSATASNSMMSSKTNTQIGAIGSKSSQSAGPTAGSNQYGQQQYMNHLYHQNSYYTNSSAQPANPYYSGPTGTGAAATGNYGMFASHGTNVSNGPPPQPQQMANFGSVGQYPLGSQMLNNLVINQQYRSGPMVNAGNNGNGNSSGSNSNAPPGGYMKQQHQSQLQDPKLSSPITDVNPSHKMYSNQNWDSSSNASSNFSGNRMYGSSQQQNSAGNLQSQNQRWSQAPGPIQRPSNSNINGFTSGSKPSQPYVNYPQNFQNSHYQQRTTRNPMNLSSMNNNSGTSTMPQGKSQYFNPIANGMKLKTDGDKSKLHAVPTSPTKAPDSKVDV